MANGRSLYQKTFSLALSQPWLAQQEKSIHSLFSECDTDEQLDLITDLLHGFTFLNQSQEQALLSRIVQDVVAAGPSESEVQIVALSAGDDPDSSQAIIYALKPLFAKVGWRSVRLVNQFVKAQQYAHENKFVFLIDEFVGTGRTLLGRVSTMKKDFANNKGVKDAKFYALAYAGMSDALTVLKDSNLFESVSFYSVLSKGISQRSSSPSAELVLMDELESKLQQILSGYNLPRLGDGGCEALYGREGGNCPNSVFPIFWWPQSSGEKERHTLLVRRF
ncbi:MAG: hypothetical protein V4673_04880 [Pseudomonadota bacterium]